jgi:AbiU2
MASNLAAMRRTMKAISDDLDFTLAFYETYVPSARDKALISRVNSVGLHPAFNIISDALHRNVFMALCRIWDRRRDTANLNRLADKFRDAKVLAALDNAGHKTDAKQVRKWLTEIDAVNKSDELSALKRARDRALAHTANPNEPYQGKARVADFGDERKVLERTIPLVVQAAAFIGYSYDVKPLEQILREHSRKFWEHIAQPAKAR